MARIARIVAAGYAHHIIQRGNRRQKTFSMMATTNLLKAIDEEAIEAFRKHERTGRPIGDNSFIEGVEKIAGRQLKLRKPGPKPKSQN